MEKIDINKIEKTLRLGTEYAEKELKRMHYSCYYKPKELSEEQKDCLDILGPVFTGIITIEGESFPKGTLVEVYGEPTGSCSGGNVIAKSGDMFAIVLKDNITKFHW